MKNKVFISKGSAANKEQQDFVDAVTEMIGNVGLSPRIMNENEWSHEQPLKAIKKIMKECDGAVLIAFTRTKFEKGIEIKNEKTIALDNIMLPTTWNHIEGAIASTYNLPLLVIAENGLKSEGLIDKGYDWTVNWTDLSVDVIKTEKSVDAEKLTLRDILNSLTASQTWKILSALITLLVAIATVSYKIGGGKFPWDK
jgi:hypothetical protein